MKAKAGAAGAKQLLRLANTRRQWWSHHSFVAHMAIVRRCPASLMEAIVGDGRLWA